MAVVEQVQGLMEDPKVKQILDRISKDKQGTALQQIAQEQFLLVVKEEDLFMKFTSLLKMQITIVEMRRIFYWVRINLLLAQLNNERLTNTSSELPVLLIGLGT